MTHIFIIASLLLALTKKQPLWQKVESTTPDIFGSLSVCPAHSFGKAILWLNFFFKDGETHCAAQPPFGYGKITKLIGLFFYTIVALILTTVPSNLVFEMEFSKYHF